MMGVVMGVTVGVQELVEPVVSVVSVGRAVVVDRAGPHVRCQSFPDG